MKGPQAARKNIILLAIEDGATGRRRNTTAGDWQGLLLNELRGAVCRR